ncbi:MAG: efflux RND transporter permease subunit [Planctomycetota bacterium]
MTDRDARSNPDEHGRTAHPTSAGAPLPFDENIGEDMHLGDDSGDRGFFALTVRRPVAMGVIFVALLALGFISFSRLPLQMLPGGISGSRFSVWIPNPGSSAEENVEKVARPLEEQFRTLPNVDTITSYCNTGRVRIRVAFDGDANTELAKAELRDRIERARPELPETVERINVWANDDGEPPIMWFAIVAKDQADDVDYLLEKHVQKRLEAVDGVSRVNIFGLLDDSIRILLDEDKVMAARMDIGSLIRRLNGDNFAQPLGEVDDAGTRYLLRADMRFKDLDEVRDYPIENGLRIGDVAKVERVKSVRDWVTRINGGYAFYGMVQRESSANIVEVGTKLQAIMDGLETEPALAGRFSGEVFFNQADFIQNSLDQLESTAVLGGGLAVLILFLFLRRVRMTLCVALSIPVSALLSLTIEYFRGGSFNILTMVGLTLAIGMLVDNAVVVVENVARLRAAGHDGKRAAVLGTRDVALAVALATLTSVAVFLPLIFFGGARMQVFMAALGIPLCTSLLLSLLIALVFLPTGAARAMGTRHRYVSALMRGIDAVLAVPALMLGRVLGALHLLFFGALRVAHLCLRALVRVATPVRFVLAGGVVWLAFGAYQVSMARVAADEALAGFGVAGAASGSAASVAKVIAAVGVAVPAALALGLLVFGLPVWRRRPSGAPARPARFAPEGTSIVGWLQSSNRALLTWTLEHRFLASLIALLAPFSGFMAASSISMTGFGDEDAQTELAFWVDLESNFTLRETSREIGRYEEYLETRRADLGFDNLVARFDGTGGTLELRWEDRQDPKDLDRIREELRRDLPAYAGHRVYFRGQDEVSDSSKQFVSFELRGPDHVALGQLGDEAVEILKQVPGLTDVASTLTEAPEQVLLELDDDVAFTYGVTSQSALRSVSWALRGAQLPRYNEAGREVPFLMEYDKEKLAGLDTLKDLTVFSEGAMVPLTTFSEIKFEAAPTEIVRREGQITQRISARVLDPTRQTKLIEEGYEALAALDLPRGYSLGRDTSLVAERESDLSDLWRMLALAIGLVFLLMGILFESLMLPFSVLTTIPYAMAGAVWALRITGTPVDFIGIIGLIILVGVVVNNGIVLIDKIHRLRLGGMDRSQAVLVGAAARVRPIMMTALTTVFGLLPMALSNAPTQGIDYKALATCVAGGLAVCTFFTLWVVPLAYTVIDDATRDLMRAVRAAFGRTAGVEPAGTSAPDAPLRGALAGGMAQRADA